MKTRTGFVSNSSSSSFVLDKALLSATQVDEIKRHGEISKERYSITPTETYGKTLSEGLGWCDPWYVKETESTLTVGTFMDNFCMERYLELIGAKAAIVSEGEYDGDEDDER
jgi:hypothetical protein